MRRSFFSAWTLSVVVTSMACGGSVSSPDSNDPDTGSSIDADGTDTFVTIDDTGTPADDSAVLPDAPAAETPVDPHGTPSDTYPAFAPDLPTLQFGGGTLIKAPVIVTITYDTDPNQVMYETFGDKIGASAYWAAVTSEYGIGPASSGATNHVRVATTPPTTVSDRDIRNLIVANAGTAWPAPTDNSIYVFIAHPSTAVASFGGRDLCKSGVGGYHSSTMVGSKRVAYAVLPQCSGSSVVSAESHELAEAATDPYQSSPGYYGFDNAHTAWDIWQQGNVENGDACEFYIDSFYTESEADFGYSVQRQWSNKGAKAGKTPCAPGVVGEPYFNVTALDIEDIKIDTSAMGGPPSFATKGYHVGVGETKTFVVGLWSEAKRANWNLKAVEGNPVLGPVTPSNLTVSMDLRSGQNGQKAFVTVTVNSASRTKYELVSIESYLVGIAHYMPILVTQL